MPALFKKRPSVVATSIVGITGIPGNISPLTLMHFQQTVEQKAFDAGGGKFVAPAQRMVDFCSNKISSSFSNIDFCLFIHSLILLLSKNIIELQGRKKDLQYSLSKAQQNTRVLASELRALRGRYFSSKAEGL